MYSAAAQRLLQQATHDCPWAALLSSGLREAAAAADDDQAAWSLRRAFDSVLANAAAAAPASPSSTRSPSSGEVHGDGDGEGSGVLLDCTAHVPAGWRPINDTVMGGASSSAFTHSAHEYVPTRTSFGLLRAKAGAGPTTAKRVAAVSDVASAQHQRYVRLVVLGVLQHTVFWA